MCAVPAPTIVTIPPPSVATVDGGGMVTIVGAGTAHILADQAGNGLYGAATQVSQTLTVMKADPSVTAWPTASAILCGQPLTASTLTGGSATPAGTFEFTTPSTVPDTVMSVQSVTFVPVDTADYNSVTGTV